MGSNLSIHNNTQNEWYVQIGPDEAAIQVTAIAFAVVAVLAGAAAKLGALAPLFVKLSANGVVSVMGVNTAGIAALTKAAAGISGLSAASSLAGAAKSLTVVLSDKYRKDGMVRLGPGQRFTWGPMSLSLWQQGRCVRSYVNPQNSQEVISEVLYMRPIFSGATDRSTLTHDIQWWINKWGVERSVIRLSQI